MFAKVDGSDVVTVYNSDGSTVRHIRAKGPVAAAYVNGEEVTVQLKNGGGAIYKIDGSTIRYFR